MIDKILSSLKCSPTSDFIYSSMSFFGRRRGGELPGTWFVQAIGSIGIEERAIRQTLFRMERCGALLTRRAGRVKFYRPGPGTAAVLDAGIARLNERLPVEWDGCWTLVHFRIGEEDRHIRDQIRDVLLVEGFAALGPALYLHPRDRSERLRGAAQDLGASDRINIFRGTHIGGAESYRLVRELWNPMSIAARYNNFIRRYLPVVSAPAAHWTPKEAFGLRFAFMFEFFRISWKDPALPQSLLPPDWPGEKARKIAAQLMEQLMPGAVRYADEIMERCPAATRNQKVATNMR
jgi:phenylacetic acid degradation operon negative regulatory protein